MNSGGSTRMQAYSSKTKMQPGANLKNFKFQVPKSSKNVISHVKPILGQGK